VSDLGIRAQAEVLSVIEPMLDKLDAEDMQAVVFELWRTRGNTVLTHPPPVLNTVLTPSQNTVLTPNGDVFFGVGEPSRRGVVVRRSKDPVVEAKCLEVLQFLNTKAGRNFRPVEENLRYIRARLNTKNTVTTVEDLKGVIARKTREWKNTEMEKYLRPCTLFRADKFEQYIGEQGT